MLNKAFEILSGYGEHELRVLGFNDLSDGKNAFERIGQIHAGSESREAKIVTWHILKKDRSKDVYELRLTKLEGETDNEYFYGVMRHMNELNPEGEIFSDMISKLQDSLAASSQAVWEWYATIKKVSIYDAHLGIFENEIASLEFDQVYFLSKVHPTHRQRVKLNWLHVLDSHEDDYSIEYRILNKEKEYKWVRSEGKVMERDSNGAPLRISGIIRDINEQKEKEQLIMKQTQKLIDYAFMNSHLLRGPASSIMGLVDLLSEEYNAENLTRLKDTALKLDESIHEINSMIEATDKEFGVINAHIQRVSLISKDSLQSLILKHTVEDISLQMEFDFNQDLDEYLASGPKRDIAELVILDEESCDDIWTFLREIGTNNPHIPVYILASRFDGKMIDRLNKETCVQGIILKSDDHHGLFEFLKTLNA
jgi:PAS domain-containing protein